MSGIRAGRKSLCGVENVSHHTGKYQKRNLIMAEYKAWILRKASLVPCACGCGTEILSLDNHGRARRFLRGHYSRISNPGLEKMARLPIPPVGTYWRANGTHWRTARTRARSLTDVSVCAWSHIDSDFTNNNSTNRLPLCRSHHRLLDNGRIEPANPIMPSYYVDTGGNRRYAYLS